MTSHANSKCKESKTFNNTYGTRRKQSQPIRDFLVTLSQKFCLFVQFVTKSIN